MKIKTFSKDTSITGWHQDKEINEFMKSKTIVDCKVTVAGTILILIMFYKE